MGKSISRRDFIKISGLGAAASTIVTGCGPVSRHVIRQQYAKMPEYNLTGVSTYFATTCRECPAGCGIIVRTQEGRAIGIQGNPNHPVNHGKLCSRGLTGLQGLYNPDRLSHPIRHAQRGNPDTQEVNWDFAIENIGSLIQSSPASQMAFMLGMVPDHLHDFTTELTTALGGPPPYRYGTQAMFDGQTTLLDAAENVFGERLFPYFDISHSDMVFSFGANFLETWLSPVTYSRAYGQMRQGNQNRRGYLVSFESRQSLTSGNADEWIPIVPGTDHLVASAIGYLVSNLQGSNNTYFDQIDLTEVIERSGVSFEKLEHLAVLFHQANNPVCIPGGASLGSKHGLLAAESALTLNVLADNVGKPGGVYLTPNTAVTNRFSDIQSLVDRMENGEIQTLFIHGWNPVFELPRSLGFSKALENVANVVSFSTFPDETSLWSDFVYPDHSHLESWGYQKYLAGSDRPILSSGQPVVSRLYDTRSTIDLFLAAINMIGGVLKTSLPYSDEVDFLQQKLSELMGQTDASISAGDLPVFWSEWLQYGGWWKTEPQLLNPGKMDILSKSTSFPNEQSEKEKNKYHFIIFPTQLGDGSQANRPWIQETPDPMTTIMWNSWVEIHPDLADTLGIRNDDVVEIISNAGSIEAVAYIYPAIRQDTIAIPFGQGHTHFSRYADQRGSNPITITELITDDNGAFCYSDTEVTLRPTGNRRPLATQEDRLGVYGEE